MGGGPTVRERGVLRHLQAFSAASDRRHCLIFDQAGPIGLKSEKYLTQLLTNLPATPTSQISQWLPDDWKRRNPPPSG